MFPVTDLLNITVINHIAWKLLNEFVIDNILPNGKVYNNPNFPRYNSDEKD